MLANCTDDEVATMLSNYSLDSRGSSRIDRSRPPRWSWRAIPREEHKCMSRDQCREKRRQMNRLVDFVAEYTAVPTAVIREMDADSFDVAHQIAVERKTRITVAPFATETTPEDTTATETPEADSLAREMPAVTHSPPIEAGLKAAPRRRVSFCEPVSSVIDDLNHLSFDSVSSREQRTGERQVSSRSVTRPRRERASATASMARPPPNTEEVTAENSQSSSRGASFRRSNTRRPTPPPGRHHTSSIRQVTPTADSLGYTRSVTPLQSNEKQPTSPAPQHREVPDGHHAQHSPIAPGMAQSMPQVGNLTQLYTLPDLSQLKPIIVMGADGRPMWALPLVQALPFNTGPPPTSAEQTKAKVHTSPVVSQPTESMPFESEGYATSRGRSRHTSAGYTFASSSTTHAGFSSSVPHTTQQSTSPMQQFTRVSRWQRGEPSQSHTSGRRYISPPPPLFGAGVSVSPIPSDASGSAPPHRRTARPPTRPR